MQCKCNCVAGSDYRNCTYDPKQFAWDYIIVPQPHTGLSLYWWITLIPINAHCISAGITIPLHRRFLHWKRYQACTRLHVVVPIPVLDPTFGASTARDFDRRVLLDVNQIDQSHRNSIGRQFSCELVLPLSLAAGGNNVKQFQFPIMVAKTINKNKSILIHVGFLQKLPQI